MASTYDLCAQERDRLLDKVAALEAELADVIAKAETHRKSAVGLVSKLAQALRERDEALAERDAHVQAILDALGRDPEFRGLDDLDEYLCLKGLRYPTPKTEESDR